MLEHLAIENFAIIEALEIDFEVGMTVLTGETGAGKSIIIDAVGLLMGGRGSADFIRYGADNFKLSGIFHMPDLSADGLAMLEDNSIPFDDDQLLIRREMHKSGRNTIKVNGVALTVALLKQLGTHIVDIHGQNEHQSLMQTSKHFQLLDQFGGAILAEKRDIYHLAYANYRQAKQELEDMSMNEQETVQRIDLLQFQINEIETSNLVVGEEESLTEERQKMQNYQKIADALGAANEGLSQSESNVVDYLGTIIAELQVIANIDDTYAEFFQQAETAYYSLQELGSDIGRQLDGLSYDPQRLDFIEERLAVFQSLKRKYGQSIEDIIAYAHSANVELAQLTNKESHMHQLEDNLAKTTKQAKKEGLALRKVREEAAIELTKAIEAQMRELYMEKARFQVKIDPANDFQANGIDRIEFFIATNLGEPFKPLVKVASGGELSRLMLAMKTIFQQSRGVTAIIFDEVDTGVSGRVAQAIANKMFEIALHAQVLCITHLPQVAAMADQQLFIAKNQTNKRTYTTIEDLSDKKRIAEVARMLTGENITDVAKQAAAEQLIQSKAFRVEKRQSEKKK